MSGHDAIVVISFPDDPHASAVVRELELRGEAVHLLDLSSLPGEASLTFGYEEGAFERLVYRRGETLLDLSRARSFWWRRPQTPSLDEITDDDARGFVWNEWREALEGAWQLAGGRWMNPPARDEVASRKALQLRLAREAGLCIPRTVMTSDPDEARAFIDRLGVGSAIFKSFSCTEAVWRETRIVRAEDLDVIDSVRLSPVIFQEFVPAAADLRVTVVGDEIFPAAIRTRPGDYQADFRPVLGNAAVEATTLPPPVEAALRSFMDRLGLVYGAVDFRLTPEGEHVFLEVNTAGEFLFVEDRTGQPIMRAVADWLAGTATTARRRRARRSATPAPA